MKSKYSKDELNITTETLDLLRIGAVKGIGNEALRSSAYPHLTMQELDAHLESLLYSFAYTESNTSGKIWL